MPSPCCKKETQTLRTALPLPPKPSVECAQCSMEWQNMSNKTKSAQNNKRSPRVVFHANENNFSWSVAWNSFISFSLQHSTNSLDEVDGIPTHRAQVWAKQVIEKFEASSSPSWHDQLITDTSNLFEIYFASDESVQSAVCTVSEWDRWARRKNEMKTNA